MASASPAPARLTRSVRWSTSRNRAT
jgi:hypothetical protein